VGIEDRRYSEGVGVRENAGMLELAILGFLY